MSVSIHYTLKIRKNTRRLRLAVHRDGEVVVTAPKRASKNSIDSFIVNQKEWIQKVIEKFKRLPAPIVPRGNRRDFLLYKKEAAELALRRLEYWNSHPAYGFRIGRITIRNQKSRWGSCSKSGNLSFSYRIALLPPELADYVIVHELCHIKEFNHKKAFWDLVAVTIPDWKERRKGLR